VPKAWASEEDPLWSKPCLAYNLHAELDDACRDELFQVLESLRLPSSWALPCPPASLHVSVATMLSVREDYGASKEVIWACWGRQWCHSLAELVAGLRPFRVRFTRLQVSAAAVIALAKPVPEVDEVRERASQLLSWAGLTPSQPSIVHCTLARYGASGQKLRALASAARGVAISAETTVEYLVVSKELVYPSLVNESLARLHLGAALA
jgi:hypothetical protein